MKKWEQTSWTGYEPPEEERLRYALIVPRLMAPHPNRGAKGALRADQGVALAVQVRIHSLQDYVKDDPSVPKFTEFSASSAWGWRFTGAFVERLVEESPEALLSVFAEAPTPDARAAACVAAACALVDFDRTDEALELIERALATGDSSTVDQAWLEVQQSRFQYEVGRVGQAIDSAQRVRDKLAGIENDPTADAISASAASLLLSLTLRDSPESFEKALIAGDTVAAWWRAQSLSSATGATVDRTFKQWARDKSVTFGGEDVADNRMLAVALAASHSGDQGGWANRTAAHGRDQLLRQNRHSDSTETVQALRELRRAGDDKSLKLALSNLADNGPAQAVSDFARGIELARTTRTTALADLAALQRGGDLLDGPSADRTVLELLEIIADPQVFAERTAPTFLLELQLVETLGGVVGAAGEGAQRAVVNRLLDMPAVDKDDQLVAQQWANVVWSLPPAIWNPEAGRRAAGAAPQHHQLLEQALLGVAARHGGDPAARQHLMQEAREGSAGALGELGSVEKLPGDVARDVISGLAARVRRQVAEAKENRIAFGGRDPAEALAVMNLWQHEVADWDALLDLLRTEEVPASQKLRTLRVLASTSDRIPAAVIHQLKPLVATLAESPPSRPSPFEPQGDVRGFAVDLGLAIGAIESDQAAETLVSWIAGDATRRRWAAHIAYRLWRCEDIGLLTALTQDTDPDVRAAAAAALAAKLPHDAEQDDLVAQALRQALRDPGVEAPKAVASALNGVGKLGAVARGLRRDLRESVSAAVRLLAIDEPDPEEEPENEFEDGSNPFLPRFRYPEEDTDPNRPDEPPES